MGLLYIYIAFKVSLPMRETERLNTSNIVVGKDDKRTCLFNLPV